MKRAAELLLRIIYPCKCIGCGKLLDIDKDKWLCGECAEDFKETTGQKCQSCGRPIDHSGKCADCRDGKIYFDKGFCALEYKGAVRNAILKFKYKGKFRYSEYFGKILSDYAAGNIAEKYHYITAVPLHRSRLRERGYDQSELIAKILADSMGVEYRTLLVRQRHTVPQNKLNKKQRQENIKNAFIPAENADIEGRSILLADDIFTTGATINECSKILKKQGAQRVDFIALSSRSEES